MGEIRYEAPKTLEAAVALLSGAKGLARVLAGGTDLLIQMRGGRVEPGLLVDIKGIPDMTAIVAENDGFRFGAAVTCMELVEHEAFATTWPGLTDAVKLIGAIQVKGRATVGGNLCNASPAADSVPALIAAAALIGSKVDADALKRLAAAASAACRPIDDKRGTREFRIKIAAVMARRAAAIALDRARRKN